MTGMQNYGRKWPLPGMEEATLKRAILSGGHQYQVGGKGGGVERISTWWLIFDILYRPRHPWVEVFQLTGFLNGNRLTFQTASLPPNRSSVPVFSPVAVLVSTSTGHIRLCYLRFFTRISTVPYCSRISTAAIFLRYTSKLFVNGLSCFCFPFVQRTTFFSCLQGRMVK